MQAVGQLKAGLQPYNYPAGGSESRWGDYSATCVDPSDGLTFWTIQEYAKGSENWGTWWGSFSTSTTSDYTDAIAKIEELYNSDTSYFGTKSGGVTSGSTTNGTFYAQWFTNGTGLLAWTDGYMYYYANSQWNSYGSRWMSDLSRAKYIINSLYAQSSSYFGTKSGGVTNGTATEGTFYVQWFANGTGLLAWPDGYMYYNNGSSWVYTGTSWK
jgi:hypothetical protein